MNTTMIFNKIYVIQSLNEDELQTGERIVNECLKPAAEANKHGLWYSKVRDRASFFATMEEIWRQCARESPRTYPIIHLDTHGWGDKSGISMRPTKEKVTWDEFSDYCRRINNECHNNLLVVSGLCFGLHTITAINMREPAPFLALIGPEETVTAGEIETGFKGFYTTLLADGDLDQAMRKLSPKFKLFLADRLFMNAFARYVRQSCKGDGRAERIERLLVEWMEKTAGQKLDEATARRILEEYTRPDKAAFERFKTRFLQSNHPDNHGRFDSLTFDVVMAAADRCE